MSHLPQSPEKESVASVGRPPKERGAFRKLNLLTRSVDFYMACNDSILLPSIVKFKPWKLATRACSSPPSPNVMRNHGTPVLQLTRHVLKWKSRLGEFRKRGKISGHDGVKLSRLLAHAQNPDRGRLCVLFWGSGRVWSRRLVVGTDAVTACRPFSLLLDKFSLRCPGEAS